jgi:sigma-54 dependent transcriptional regulator, acetoin dehydrogenase operon transcriptional activator AcoR
MAVLDVMSRQTLRAREEFLSGGSPREPVRSDIVASWRRSLLSGADPDVTELPYNDYDQESHLQRSGHAVLDVLADLLDGSTAALLLADGDARIIGRWVGSHHLSRVMDSTCSAPGFSLEETACGTNGLGSVLEERRLFHVTGAEHYAARFLRYSCCGAPVQNPISGRLDGVVTLVCPGEDANRLMAPIVLQAASAIEERLAEDAGRAERQLLATFLAQQRDTRRPVVAINERAVIATPAAARTFDPDQLAVLWEHVAGVVANRRPEHVELRAADNRTIICDCRPLLDGGVVHGALVEIGPAIERRTTAAAATAAIERDAIRLAGSTRGWRQVMHEAARVRPSPLPLLVSGPPGSGKLELVRSIHDQAVARGRFVVVDAGLSMVESTDAWLRHLVDTLSGDDEVVVVRHIDQMDKRMANVLGTVMDHRSGRPIPRVVATVTTGDGGHPLAVAGLVDRFVHRLDVPSLNARRDDIPDIVSALVERHRPGSGRRFSAEALQALMRADWPRNVRQLENAVLGALQRRDFGDVSLDDLPHHLVTPSHSGLTPMQQAELEAVLAAMRKSNGNKQEAAATLGIARSTLYRKLREFGLDLDRVAY